MVKPRVSAVLSTTTPILEEPDPLAAGLEAHRAETAASLNELRSSMLASMRSQADSMKSELMEELRQLRLGSYSPSKPQTSCPLPLQQGSSSARQGELEPVISQVIPYQPLSAPPPLTSGVSTTTTVDLSVLPLYYSCATSGMFAPNIVADRMGSIATDSTQIPVCSVNSSSGYNGFDTGPWYFNPYVPYNP